MGRARDRRTVKTMAWLLLTRHSRTVAIFADNNKSFLDIVHIPSHRRTYKQPFSAPPACSIPRPPTHLSRLSREYLSNFFNMPSESVEQSPIALYDVIQAMMLDAVTALFEDPIADPPAGQVR